MVVSVDNGGAAADGVPEQKEEEAGEAEGRGCESSVTIYK